MVDHRFTPLLQPRSFPKRLEKKDRRCLFCTPPVILADVDVRVSLETAAGFEQPRHFATIGVACRKRPGLKEEIKYF